MSLDTVSRISLTIIFSPPSCCANATISLVKTSILGGSVVTRVNLFTGGHLLYTGGAIVNYTLFDASGKVISSGLVVGAGTHSKAEKFLPGKRHRMSHVSVTAVPRF